MKKSLFLSLALILLYTNLSYGQIGGFLKKAAKSVAKEVTGKTDNNPAVSQAGKSEVKPDPACACEQAELVLDLGGSLKLDFKELTLSVADDGSILAKDQTTNEYYIINEGLTKGPLHEGDPALAKFDVPSDDKANTDYFIQKFKPYIARSGEKYLITFGGKSYGPYGQINDFSVSKAKDKFAAKVIENVINTADDGKKMEEAMKNAKTDQEKMDLAMKFSQQMQQKMIQGGGAQGMLPKLVTNIPNAAVNPSTTQGNLNNSIKYDEILLNSYNKVVDLQGEILITLKPEFIGAQSLFVNASNTKYAIYNYGNLVFSDDKTMSELFNPHLVKAGENIYLAYMYYSPKRNAIMQCRIPF